jgi:hypothetical protein
LDNLTHTLFAATLARAGLEKAGRGATAALVLASYAPDVEIVWVADRMRRLTLRYLDQWTPQTRTAATARTAQAFLGFSRFPAARTYMDPTGAATVRWNDVRFAGGIFGLDLTAQPSPFTVTVRLGPTGRVVREQVGEQGG